MVNMESAALIQPVSEPVVSGVLGDNEAAVIDTFAGPSYLRHYWELSERLLLVGEASRVVHLRCLTGYPDSELLRKMPNTTGVGVDASPACLSIAGAKMDAFGFEYLHADPEATPLPGENFSHGFLLHAPGSAEARRALFRELARLVYPEGQIVVSLPLGSSFAEIVDLLAEYALKHDDSELALAIEAFAADPVTVQTVSQELEEVGLKDVAVEEGETSLLFDSGHALLEEPACRFFVFPQIAEWLEIEDLGDALVYVARAVDKYWSDEKLELGVQMASISARR